MPNETGTLADYFTPRKQPGETGLPVLSVTINDGLVPRDSLDRRTESAMEAKAHSLVEPGDIAYNMMRMWQGASGLCRVRANISPAYVVMTPKANTDPAFAAHWLKSKDAIDLLWAYSHGLTEDRLRLYPDDFLSIPATFPAFDDQRRIATVLDAWDAAIATTEQLAVAQRKLRVCVEDSALGQGALTRFTEAADIRFSGVDKKIVDGEHRVRLCNYMDVLKNRRLTDSIDYSAGSATQGEVERFALKEGDVVFTKDSETAAEIAEPAYVTEALTGVVCGYHLGIARPKEGVSGAYLTHAIRSKKLRQQFVKRANGAIRFGLTLETMEQVELPMPGLNRQVAIAGALDAVDDEVIRLVALGEMLRQQKRGLMQQILTGRLRVSESIDALRPPAPELVAA